MADAIIDRINPTDLGLITHLYNQVFRPESTEEDIQRRIQGRAGPLVMVARIGDQAVGFYVGMELRPGAHFAWVCGVVPEMRRSGIATQLMHSAEEWCKTAGYRYLRFECDNKIRAFMHFGIVNGYDIVGLRLDQDNMSNLVLFEKSLQE